MDLSNKFLAWLLVIAILITLIGTIYSVNRINRLSSITGYGIQGYVNVSITQWVMLNITQPDCNFGSGYVTPPYAYAILHPGASGGGCGEPDTKNNWTNTTAYNPDCMVVRNDGNVKIKVDVSSGKNATIFIGGTDPEYKVWSLNKEDGACESGAVSFPGIEMNASNKTICSSLKPGDANDELYVGCYLKIPDNAAPAAKADTWTFTATAV